MRLVAYYRPGDPDVAVELDALSRWFIPITSLDELRPGDLVLARFSTLPFSADFEREVRARGARLIQSEGQRQYLADLRCWYRDIERWTPRTVERIEDVDWPGPCFVKGALNSRRTRWHTHAYAADGPALERVVERLRADPLVGGQPLCIREFVPLAGEGVDERTGVPISEEYRFFVADGEILVGGYYWAFHARRLGLVHDPATVPSEWLREVVGAVGDQAAYYSLDVARTRSGEWIVIELGDGAMSGLSSVDPETLYSRLAARLRRRPGVYVAG